MVEVSFYLLSFVATAMLLLLFRGYPPGKVVIWLSFGMAMWLMYLLALDQLGALRSFDMPPRIPLLVVFPAITIILIAVNRKFMRQALENTPLYLPIALQSFRILVELLIYATYQQGTFPQRATFEGLNFDILVGISAILASVAIARNLLKRQGILIWNIASMSILSLTVYSFISTYYFTDFGTSAIGFDFVQFPYLLLASVLLPIAIFLHVFSLRQILISSKAR